MKIVNNAILKDKYDVIVIGAGVGGLATATLLAKKGFDVLLCENHFMPGGCCSAVRRGGVTSDVGASLLFGFGTEGLTQHHFFHNIVEEPIDVIRDDSIFRVHWKTKTGEYKEVTVWRDFEKYMESLTASFPGKESVLRKFYEFLEQRFKSITKVEMPMAFTEIPISLALKMLKKSPIGMLKVAKLLNITGLELMNKFFTDPELVGFFDMIIMTMNMVKSDVNPGLLSGMVFAECNHGGAYYPIGSPQMVPNIMEKAFDKFNGKPIYRHKVSEILFDTQGAKPQAIGVKLDDNTKIYGNDIVYAGNIYNLFGGLIPAEICGKEKVEETMKLEASSAVFPAYLSVDAKAIPKNTRPVEVFISDITDLERADIRFVFTPSLEDSTLAPEGVHSMSIIQRGNPNMWPRPSDPFYQSEGYNKLKQKVADDMLKDMEQFFPDLRKHIRTIEIATPTTFERFTMKYKGNIGGPVQKMGQQLWKRVHARVKGYKNLYMAGDSTTMGTGVVSSLISGVSAANSILKDTKKGKIYLPQKFKQEFVKVVKEKEISLKPLLAQKQKIEEVDDARRWARECNWCDKDNCRKQCPSQIDVNNFLRRVEVGNFKGAAKLIRETNPLAEICGIICPSEKFCEKDCYRREYSDAPVRIKDLHAWVCKVAGKEGWTLELPKPNGLKVAIIGAGPAGLSCSYYLSRLGYQIDIFEKRKIVGGIVSQLIPSFRLPKEVIDRDLNGILAPNISIHYEKEFGKDILLEDLLKNYNSVFIATGLWEGKKLELIGLTGSKVTDALTFIEMYNKQELKKIEDKILIIGGGSVAADAASVAKKAGAKQITLVCLENEVQTPMLKHELEELKAIGVNINNSWGPKEVKENKLRTICCTNVFDEKDNFCPEFDEKKTKEFEFQRIIMAVGQKLESNLSKYIKATFGSERIPLEKDTLKVIGKENLYAGGDIIRGTGTVVQAVADGRKVAMNIHQKLMKN